MLADKTLIQIFKMNTKKNIFIFDQNKCVACHACVLACMNENGFQFHHQWRNVHQSQSLHLPGLALFYLSMACNHCDDAPCLENCPAKAFSLDKLTGAVIHSPDKCIGCKYCTWACPFDAPEFIPNKGIIEKCTFCNHRIGEKQKPACAELCPVGALDFQNTEFTRTESFESSPVEIDAGSHLKVITLRKKTGPEQDLSLFKESNKKITEVQKAKKINAVKEWPLVIFTLLSAVLVSIYASGISNEFSLPHKFMWLSAGFVSAGFSILHLGKKLRARRSLINIRNSWLSKEILFMVLFYVSVFIDFFMFDIPDYISIAIGLLFLYSIDKLYSLAQYNWRTKIHSAQTLLILFTLTLIMKELYILLLIVISTRVFLYVFRKYYADKRMILLSVIRILCLLFPILTFFIQIDVLLILIIVCTGEIIDRIEFYNELSLPDPAVEFPLK